MNFSDPVFWTSLMEIIGINIILSGDNAVVIALAARSLPPKQQKMAIALGSAAAIVMRVILTIFAVQLLSYPYLKLAGAALLLWIGVQLLLGDDDGGADGLKVKGNENLFAAVRTILVADLVMSLDNVIGVAAAAKGSIPLLVIGLAISIPLIIFSSTIILKLMERFPVIITLGAGLLGWVAGEMGWEDPAISHWTQQFPGWLEYAVAVAGAGLVVILGRTLAARQASASAKEGGS
jgi:YjbE family integral membrane protein